MKVTENGKSLSASRRLVNGPGSDTSKVDLIAAWRLISNNTNSLRSAGRRLSRLSTTASVVTVASTVDFSTSTRGKLSAATGLLASAWMRRSTSTVTRCTCEPALVAKELYL